MKVSVITPVRDRASFIGRCLDSVLAQTRVPDEIFVIDDGSTDESAAIAHTYSPAVMVLPQRPQGPAVARNLGLDRSSGDVIAFLDADDWWERDKLKRQLEYLDAHPRVGLCHTATNFVDVAGRPVSRPNADLKPLMHGWCLAELLQRNPITMSSVVLRRSALGNERCDVTLTRASDWDLWLRLASQVEFAYLDERLTGYQFHGANISLDTEPLLRASAEVMKRAMARGLPPAEMAIAKRAHRNRLLDLGHLYYESGRWAEARDAYWEDLAVREDITATLRCLATYLPGSVHARARMFWRVISRNGDESERRRRRVS
jgi:glycosyltransferase involved in cell wall biosynthesis